MPSPASEHLKSHQIVRAGAGAGKTYALTHKVMDIAEQALASEGRLPKVVVTTFTRKATGELRERLMVLALEEKPHLIDFVNSRSHLVVSTIHGVMDLFLKRFGANLNVDPSYQVAGPAEAGKIARQVLRKILLRDKDGERLLESMPFNRICSLVRRLDLLLLENPDARPFLMDDFESLFKTHALGVARLLDSAAFNIKEESTKANWLAMAADYLALSNIIKKDNWRSDREAFVSRLQGMKTAPRNAKAPPVTDMTADEAESARDAAKKLAEDLFDPANWQIFSGYYEIFDRLAKAFAQEFRNEKMRRGLLEISDLETLAMDCARKFPETAEAFWQEWDYWLIDEYQDTSPFQVELLRKLSGERPNFIVGDPQQSIYLFRGARSEVFAQKEAEILSAGGEQKLLKMNRRSKPELLIFFNDFFAHLAPAFQPMDPMIKEGERIDPKKRVATIFIAPGAEPNAPEQKRTESEAAEQLTDSGETVPEKFPEKFPEKLPEKHEPEMRALISHIQSLLQNGAKFEDICILGRTNRTLTEVALWLAKYRLPAHVHSSSGFYDRREIRDALALLKFLVNPHDNYNLIELFRSPWFRSPDQTLAEVAAQKPESYWASLSQSAEDPLVLRMAAWLRETMVNGLAETFRHALIDSGLFDLSHLHDVSGRRESNLWKLLAKLQQEECRPGFNPVTFITESLSDLKVDQANAEGDAVAAVEPDRINLMTVHSSKGLEFKHVILPQMAGKPRLTSNEDFTYDEDAGLWCLRVPLGEDHEMAQSLPEHLWLEKFRELELKEHARVLYVALTRAIESVYMSWTGVPPANSWADLVRLDLAPGVHETPHYTYEVLDQEPELKAVELSSIDVARLRQKWNQTEAKSIEFGSAKNTPADWIESISVTDLLERSTSLVFSAGSNPEIAKRLKLASEGTAVHRMMELLKYPSQTRLKQVVQKWFPGREDKILSAIEFVRVCAEPPLLEIIQNGYVEWPFAMLEKGYLVEGQLDLWGRTHAGVPWIIDYKTGSSKYKNKAFEQMSLYAIALRKSGLVAATEKIYLAAVYPFLKEVFVNEELKS